jgi:2-polyprenyl-3-methyl-5-hydroxy-6-metoxy-1,4-benzoquinol methylase
MEYLNQCPLCGSGEQPAHYMSCPDHMLGTGNFSMVRCKDCDLVYTNPRPYEINLGAFYQSPEYISHTEQKRNLREKIYYRVQSYMLSRKAALINGLEKNNKRLLDVGCGTGAFAKHMQDAGYQVVALEPQAAAREKARQKGLQVFDNQEEELKFHTNALDVITLWHVLEHQVRFMDSLKQYHHLLAPGGWLIIAVPQYQSFDAGFYKEFWAAYDLPRHLLHFSEQTLNAAASQSGFKLIEKKGMPFDAFYVSLLSEKYKGGLGGFLRALLVGFWSNLIAFLNIKPWSSQIFVFRKA